MQPMCNIPQVSTVLTDMTVGLEPLLQSFTFFHQFLAFLMKLISV